ncbi:hypothetical protein PAXRUDRAFT_830298, partial [Paxillus rubicundulus Ve08.2h10]
MVFDSYVHSQVPNGNAYHARDPDATPPSQIGSTHIPHGQMYTRISRVDVIHEVHLPDRRI